MIVDHQYGDVLQVSTVVGVSQSWSVEPLTLGAVCIEASGSFVAGRVASEVFAFGSVVGQVFVPGRVASEACE